MITLRVADLAIAMTATDPAWEAALARRFAAFITQGPAAWQVEVRCEPTLTEADAPWVRHAGPVTEFRVAASVGGVDLARTQAWVSAAAEAQAAPAVERVLTYILMQALPRRGDALLLHAAGIVYNNQGYVFAGASAAGKTTIARLAAGHAEVLCDENVVVQLSSIPPLPAQNERSSPAPPLAGKEARKRVGASSWRLLSTPFWGHSTPPEMIRRVNRQAPLQAIYLLAQAAEFRCTPLAPAEAVLALLTTEKVAIERPESAAAWLAVTERLIADVPIYRLEFRPTPELWEFLAEKREGRKSGGS